MNFILCGVLLAIKNKKAPRSVEPIFLPDRDNDPADHPASNSDAGPLWCMFAPDDQHAAPHFLIMGTMQATMRDIGVSLSCLCYSC